GRAPHPPATRSSISRSSSRLKGFRRTGRRQRDTCRMFRDRDPLRRRPMAAVSVERLVQELEKLKQQMDAGALKARDYDQRLARVIRELRERKLDAARPAIAAGLAAALRRRANPPAAKPHSARRL